MPGYLSEDAMALMKLIRENPANIHRFCPARFALPASLSGKDRPELYSCEPVGYVRLYVYRIYTVAKRDILIVVDDIVHEILQKATFAGGKQCSSAGNAQNDCSHVRVTLKDSRHGDLCKIVADQLGKDCEGLDVQLRWPDGLLSKFINPVTVSANNLAGREWTDKQQTAKSHCIEALVGAAQAHPEMQSEVRAELQIACEKVGVKDCHMAPWNVAVVVQQDPRPAK
ncbi:hypothetical protein M885DRAFT_576236 [Pelagophyceae sp. CCMP2097]|nr:hypothetical protein M885DRAFT_576236 [Pelagophyceae sp. CCMP2097]